MTTPATTRSPSRRSGPSTSGSTTTTRPGRRPGGRRRRAATWVGGGSDAAGGALAPGGEITGWPSAEFGGAVDGGRGGLVPATLQGHQPFDTLAAWLRAEQALGGAGL